MVVAVILALFVRTWAVQAFKIPTGSMEQNLLIGDHQPPSLVSGEGASWDVPVHVIASRASLLEQFRRAGFADGLAPSFPAIVRMDELLLTLLSAFGDPPDTAMRH